MKQILNLINLAFAFGLIFYINHYVNAGDVCRTIFGCFALYTWFDCCKRRE